MEHHKQFMRRALALARCAEGLTRPNPPVGALLVLNGDIIAEGLHKKAGGPHAEVNCLNRIKNRTPTDLKSATLYITLEPCSTTRRTPPCTDLILSSGIRRVVVSIKDPNPAHAGRGYRILRRAGIEVITGVCRKEGAELIMPYSKRMLTGLPYVTLKLAATLDGQIADAFGKSKWITSPQARAQVHMLRRRVDAIMVGAATVRVDDPSLLPRPTKGRIPWRVIVGTNIPPSSKILTDRVADRTLLMSGSLKKILSDLGQRNVMHVLCEGGGELAGALIRAKLVDEFIFFMAPALLGGDGIPMVGEKGWSLTEMPRLDFQTLENCGKDILIKAFPTWEK